MKLWTTTGTALLACMFLTAAAHAGAATPARQLQVGDPAPNVPLALSTGARSYLGAMRGNLLLVDFFLTT